MDIIKGFFAGLAAGLILPIIITSMAIILGIVSSKTTPPVQYAKFTYSLIFLGSVFISIVFVTAIGALFGRYATYERGRREPFKNFVIGAFLGFVILSDLLSGITQAAFVYIGCILGEKWKEK